MENWKKVAVKPSNTIFEVLDIIDKRSSQIALVVDDNDRLIGTITDGDIRRALLKGLGLDNPAELVCNKNPIVAYEEDDQATIENIIKKSFIRQLPILNKQKKVVGLILLKEFFYKSKRENRVVLMAGGQGSRLWPLTEKCPKPLLKVGGKPILETILENFIEYDFQYFYIAVNYKAKMIEEYFRNGSNWGVNIRYLREKSRMGTAGALSLLSEIPQSPIIVMNGDLLTKVNFNQLLDFHKQNQNSATVCVRSYDFQVPFGVAQVDDQKLKGLVEKPIHKFFVNAGIYVLEPNVLEYIPKNQYFDMTTLLEHLITINNSPTVFPVREYWLDIGQIDDFKLANGEYNKIQNKIT